MFSFFQSNKQPENTFETRFEYFETRIIELEQEKDELIFKLEKAEKEIQKLSEQNNKVDNWIRIQEINSIIHKISEIINTCFQHYTYYNPETDTQINDKKHIIKLLSINSDICHEKLDDFNLNMDKYDFEKFKKTIYHCSKFRDFESMFPGETIHEIFTHNAACKSLYNSPLESLTYINHYLTKLVDLI